MVLSLSRGVEARRETKTIKDLSHSLRPYLILLSVVLGVCHEGKLSIQHKRYKTLLLY